MTSKIVGPHAFPRPFSWDESASGRTMGDGPQAFCEQDGMSLRDYFAAAVAGHIWECMDSELDSGTAATGTAQKAYMVADAMLKERSK